MKRALVFLLLLSAWAAGCGESAAPVASPAPAEPALARLPRGPGEVVVRGELSPDSHGPYTFAGTYDVAFEQYAPEDPRLDFRQQTSFVALLDTEAEIERPDSIRLFERSRRRGSRRGVELHGRYFVDVTFGDFPYVIRFTPVR